MTLVSYSAKIQNTINSKLKSLEYHVESALGAYSTGQTIGLLDAGAKHKNVIQMNAVS